MLTLYNSKGANGAGKGNRKRSVATISAFIIMLAGFGGLTSPVDAATVDIPVKTVHGNTKTIYHKYHDTVANLPQAFTTHGDEAQLYSSNDGNSSVIYCLEVTNDTMDPDMNEHDVPDPALTPEQEGLLYHVMSHGPHKFNAQDEEAYKNQYARQLAVWLICENLHNDNSALDSVLFPAAGDYQDTEGYAQTLEIGRLARKALNEAKAAYAAGTHKNPIPVPSFLTEDATSTTAYDMTWDSVNKEWKIVLDDTNGTLSDAWVNAHIKVHDPTSMALDFTISGNSMTIKGLPSYSPRKIEFDNSLPNGTVKYLRNMSDATHASFQRMARFAQVDKSPLYLTLRTSSIPGEPGNPGNPEKPNVPNNLDKTKIPKVPGVKGKVSSRSPQTEDDSNIEIFIILLSIAAITIAVIGLNRIIEYRRNRSKVCHPGWLRSRRGLS